MGTRPLVPLPLKGWMRLRLWLRLPFPSSVPFPLLSPSPLSSRLLPPLLPLLPRSLLFRLPGAVGVGVAFLVAAAVAPAIAVAVTVASAAAVGAGAGAADGAASVCACRMLLVSLLVEQGAPPRFVTIVQIGCKYAMGASMQLGSHHYYRSHPHH